MKNILIVIVVLCAFGLILFWFFSEKNVDDSKEVKILKKVWVKLNLILIQKQLL